MLGQDAFVDSVVRAMRRPFVLGTEAPAARNVILPVPAPPVSRMTLRAAGASVPSTKGRRMARTTLSTKEMCIRDSS